MVRPQGSPFQTVKQISILLKCHYKNFCMALLISWPALNFNAVLGCKVSSKYGPCLTLIWLYLLSTHQPLTCWELWQRHLSWDVTEKKCSHKSLRRSNKDEKNILKSSAGEDFFICLGAPVSKCDICSSKGDIQRTLS